MQIHGSNVSDHAQVPQSGHALVFHFGSSSLDRRPPSSWPGCSYDPTCRASASSFGKHDARRSVVFFSRRSFESGSAVVILEVARTDVIRQPRFFFFCLVVLEPSTSFARLSCRTACTVIIILAAPSSGFYLRRTSVARDGTSPSPKQYSLGPRFSSINQVSHSDRQWIDQHVVLVPIGVSDRSAADDGTDADIKGDRWYAEFDELDGWW